MSDIVFAGLLVLYFGVDVLFMLANIINCCGHIPIENNKHNIQKYYFYINFLSYVIIIALFLAFVGSTGPEIYNFLINSANEQIIRYISIAFTLTITILYLLIFAANTICKTKKDIKPSHINTCFTITSIGYIVTVIIMTLVFFSFIAVSV